MTSGPAVDENGGFQIGKNNDAIAKLAKIVKCALIQNMAACISLPSSYA